MILIDRTGKEYTSDFGRPIMHKGHFKEIRINLSSISRFKADKSLDYILNVLAPALAQGGKISIGTPSEEDLTPYVIERYQMITPAQRKDDL